MFRSSGQKVLNKGLPAKIEKGQGIAIKIRNRAMENHRSIVPNLSASAVSRLASALPMVMRTMARIIRLICMIPKKESSLWAIAPLVSAKNSLISGLVKYKKQPSISWIWAMVAVQCRMESSALVKGLPRKPLYARRMA